MITGKAASRPSLLRKLNTTHVLRMVRASGPLSRTALARETGLSQLTVNQIANRLVQDGLLVEEAADSRDQPARPGRQAALLSFNGAAGYLLGLDLNSHQIVALLADLNGNVLGRARRSIAERTPHDAAALLPEILAATTEALRQVGVEKDRLVAACVGIPGAVEPDSGRVHFIPDLPDWDGVVIRDTLADALSCPVLVENDVRLAILGECGWGSAQETDNAVYLHLGTGIGLGILIEGELYRGARGGAGEIGYLPTTESRGSPDGLFGSFEWAAGATAFARLGRAAAADPDSGRLLRDLANGDPDRVDAAVVLQASRQGDAAARGIISSITEKIAQGLVTVNCLLNPGVIILGGKTVLSGLINIGELRTACQALSPLPLGPLVATSLGDEVVALGAIQAALNVVEDRMLGGDDTLQDLLSKRAP